MVRKGGRVAVIGLPLEDAAIPMQRLVLDEIDLVGVRATAGEMPRAIELAATGRLRLRELITHRFALEDFADAYATFTERRDGALKVIVAAGRGGGVTDRRVLCSCAVTGGMSVPGQSAAIPVTPEEIVDSAVAAHAAGAAIVHIHVREPETGRPVADLGLFREVLAGIARALRRDRPADHRRRRRHDHRGARRGW